MQQLLQRGRQDKIAISQDKLISSLEKLTKEIIEILEQNLTIDSFKLDQREKILDALKLSELVDGPIGADNKKTLLQMQYALEQVLTLRIKESYSEIVDFTSKTKDLKKYNLNNVR